MRKLSRGHKIKRLKKEKKKLRKLAGKLARERDGWKQRYEELNRYVERAYKDYA